MISSGDLFIDQVLGSISDEEWEEYERCEAEEQAAYDAQWQYEAEADRWELQTPPDDDNDQPPF